jgi:hypothetical protein
MAADGSSIRVAMMGGFVRGRPEDLARQQVTTLLMRYSARRVCGFLLSGFPSANGSVIGTRNSKRSIVLTAVVALWIPHRWSDLNFARIKKAKLCFLYTKRWRRRSSHYISKGVSREITRIMK